MFRIKFDAEGKGHGDMSYKVKQGMGHRGYVRTTRPPTTTIKKPITTLRRPVVQTGTSSTPTVTYGNASQWNEFTEWLNSSEKFKCLLLVGPTGCGKTHVTYAKALEHGRRVYEINAGNITGNEQIQEDIYHACTCTTSTLGNTVEGADVNCKNLVLLDDIDGFPDNVINTICSLLRSKNRPSPCEPIVCTCSASHSAIKQLRQLCNKVIWLNPIDDSSLQLYAKRHFPNKMQETIKIATKKCGGDLRQFILYLTYAAGSSIDSKRGLWDTIAATLRQDANSRQLCGYHEPQIVHNMLFENYAKFAMNETSLDATADAFSILDILRSGNTRSLKAEAWELAYRLPVRVRIATNQITYTPRFQITRTFSDFEKEFRSGLTRRPDFIFKNE